MTNNSRWMVVDRNRTPVWTAMYSETNAQMEADRLNESGPAELRPYRVVRDVYAECMTIQLDLHRPRG